MSVFFAFLGRQFTTLPEPTQSFHGQTIIVTGSNIGLGLEAARHFARLDATKVILAVRSIAKGEEAARSIHESTGRKGVCEVWQLDMGNFDSVKEFAQRAAKLERLDAVLENAGINTMEYVAMEGFESTIAVNVVGTFLLALNLLPILRKSGKKHGTVPRLTITSSDVHLWVSYNHLYLARSGTNRFRNQAAFAERHENSIFEALNNQDKYPKYKGDRYNTSKLLEVFTVRALAEKIATGPHAKEPLIVNNVNPGLCHSSLARNMTGPLGLIFSAVKLILARKTEVGGATLVFAASAGEESNGQYMSECVVTPPSDFVRSGEGKKTQERVYTELLGVLEKIQPGISKNI